MTAVPENINDVEFAYVMPPPHSLFELFCKEVDTVLITQSVRFVSEREKQQNNPELLMHVRFLNVWQTKKTVDAINANSMLLGATDSFDCQRKESGEQYQAFKKGDPYNFELRQYDVNQKIIMLYTPETLYIKAKGEIVGDDPGVKSFEITFTNHKE